MNLSLQHIWKYIVLSLILITGVLLSIHTLYLTKEINNGFSFPLDDSWIHLQFARNIHDYGAFSYYKNEMITSGSTSPLYTILLAIGFFFTSNEMILGYVLGIAFLAVASVMIYKLGAVLFDGNIIFALAAALLFIFEPRMQWIALSGMETTLFIAILLGVIYFYYTKKPILLGIASGLLLWARPEAVILFGIIALIFIYEAKVVKNPSYLNGQSIIAQTDFVWIRKSALYATVIIIAYFLFNLYLSGSILPNTYAAKLKYYSGSGTNFLNEVFHFLTDGHLFVPAMLAMISGFVVIWNLFKRQSSVMIIPLMWSLLLFVAYWINLPRLYQNGRYLMPLIPCFLLLCIDGLRIILDFTKSWFLPFTKLYIYTIAMAIVVFIFATHFFIATIQQESMYAESCRYISDRQVKTALWIRDYLPQNSIVATHDIGAITFYSERHIVDMMGLVSPDMINNIGRFDLLKKFLVKNGTTHIATLRNWFEVVNMKPLFQTDPRYLEIMEVFPFDSTRHSLRTSTSNTIERCR